MAEMSLEEKADLITWMLKECEMDRGSIAFVEIDGKLYEFRCDIVEVKQ